ncbi:phosphate uptake regulator PhoU [Ureaplasma miroungigenitalium]|uniref:Phosphate uptake regulator PhoU n=1 Tax=Ureaplasma miroungigenitalium TaxID=1042321 RepID=A0ABT3BN05_9BACT|nr:PhoU domain-containing protein [Ureaplasma miroungigenitalium]MCV3728614.1 phosphate uptake regulator PhoU [Ureaplasma miroungigenitalium]MCV3734306.1 phosphate uptake regulator PhoU [Ureaplasma miroungigenitalium]
MATNYSMMKESQTELLDSFKKFYKRVLDNTVDLCDKLQKQELTYKEIYNDALFKEEQVNLIYSDMIDECVWTIQKDQPRAGHLRFFISVINSVKDLERISDHNEIISEYFEEYNFSDEERKHFLLAFEASNKILFDFYQHFLNNNFNSELVDEIKRVRDQYLNDTNKKQMRTVYIDDNLTDEEMNSRVKLILMYRHIERNIDHAINILQNFGNVHISSK